LIWDNAKNEWNTYRLSFGGNTEISDHSSLNLSGWMQNSHMDTQNASNASYSLATPTAGIPYVSQIENASYSSVGSSAYLKTEMGNFKDIKFGADYRTISTNDPLNIFSSTAYKGTITSEATHNFEGLFLQGIYRPEGIALDITPGLREDFWQARDASIIGNYAGSNINNQLASQSFTHFDPRLGAKYYLNDAVDLRAAAYQNFSAPGLNQMYRSFVSGTGYTIPNTALQAQTNVGYELGMDLKSDTADLALTAYSNKVNNYIDYSTVQTGCASGNNYCGTGVSSATTIKQYVNAGDATMSGFEILGNWHVNSTLSLNAGFSRTIAYLTSSKVATDPTGQQLGQIPLWVATAGANWQASDRLRFALTLRDFPDYWNNTAHTQVNQGALTADLGVDYKYDKTIDLFAYAQNIGSKSYYDQGLSYNSNGTVNTSSSGTTPALGMPFNLTAGIRITF